MPSGELFLCLSEGLSCNHISVFSSTPPSTLFNCSDKIRTGSGAWQINQLFQLDESFVKGGMITFPDFVKQIAFSAGEVLGYLGTARVPVCRGHVSLSTRGSFLQLTLEPPFHCRARKVDY